MDARMRSVIVFFAIGALGCGSGGPQREEPGNGGSGGSAGGEGGAPATGGQDSGFIIINVDASVGAGGCIGDACPPPQINDGGSGFCGDGIVGPSEECDDGNSVPG